MSESVDIRPYQTGEEEQILKLFSLSFGGRNMPPQYWKWRFCDNPSGKGIIELAWKNNLLAAHYAVTTLQMSIEGRCCFAGLSGTTMTNPVYRGRGLFPILARHAYQEMSNRGMAMVWGFPNAISHRGFIYDLEWKDIYEVPMFRLKLESDRLVSGVESSYVIELSAVDDRFDHFWKSICHNYDIIVRRDREYIHWRYFSNPNEQYRLIAHVSNEEIKGYAVFKRYNDELQVVDILLGKSDTAICESLINFILLQAIDVKARSICLWLNVVHPLHHTLEKMGFRPEGPVTYLGGLILNPDLNASLYDFRRWYFTMSDSDVY